MVKDLSLSKRHGFSAYLKKKQKLNWGDQLIVEYEERMEQNVKEKRKKSKSDGKTSIFRLDLFRTRKRNQRNVRPIK